MLTKAETNALEIDLLSEAIFRQYGFDFRSFAREPLEQKLAAFCIRERVKNLSLLQAKILHDEACFKRLLGHVAGEPVTLFRSPAFFACFREHLIPVLRTYPTVRLWIPGCGRGADAFSLAVLLSEEGLLSRVRIYATDFDQKTIEEAAEGRVTAARFKQSLENFTAAGGTGDLHRFFTRVEDGFRLKPAIRKTVFFTVHSLMTDRSFNEFHAIVARDVLSAFQSPLLERAFNIFHESLGRFGFLGLGDEESLSKNPNRRCYEPLLDGGALWWRKVADQ